MNRLLLEKNESNQENNYSGNNIHFIKNNLINNCYSYYDLNINSNKSEDIILNYSSKDLKNSKNPSIYRIENFFFKIYVKI